MHHPTNHTHYGITLVMLYGLERALREPWEELGLGPTLILGTNTGHHYYDNHSQHSNSTKATRTNHANTVMLMATTLHKLARLATAGRRIPHLAAVFPIWPPYSPVQSVPQHCENTLVE